MKRTSQNDRDRANEYSPRSREVLPLHEPLTEDDIRAIFADLAPQAPARFNHTRGDSAETPCKVCRRKLEWAAANAPR